MPSTLPFGSLLGTLLGFFFHLIPLPPPPPQVIAALLKAPVADGKVVLTLEETLLTFCVCVNLARRVERFNSSKGAHDLVLDVVVAILSALVSVACYTLLESTCLYSLRCSECLRLSSCFLGTDAVG